jgi:hypothetical protein
MLNEGVGCQVMGVSVLPGGAWHLFAGVSGAACLLSLRVCCVLVVLLMGVLRGSMLYTFVLGSAQKRRCCALGRWQARLLPAGRADAHRLFTVC